VALDFGVHQDVVFGDAPLVSVLCQVRFPPVLSLLSIAGVTGFQTGLRSEYPEFLPPERNASVEFGPENVGVKTSAPTWRLATEDKQWVVGIAADFVSLQTPAYTDIDDFLRRLAKVLQVLRRTVRPADSVRIGLRKVNLIPMPRASDTASLVGVVRSEMLGPLAVNRFPAPIAGCFSQLHFVDDDCMLVVNYGLGKSDDSDVGFVLDLDYFTERPQRVEDGPDLLNLIRHFSEGMTSFFHWALEDDFKQSLTPRARNGANGAS